MKTKKPKRRFNTANQIRDEIDKYKGKREGLLIAALSLEVAGKELMKIPSMIEDAKFKLKEAERLRRSAQRITENRLRHLKDKLAEWQTDLLPGVIDNNDRSIQS